MPTHLRLFLGILGLIFFVFSCSSSKSQNDSDSIPDSDADTQDTEIQNNDYDTQEVEIVYDSDETSDTDQDADSDTEEKVECLDLRYNENTIKTPFPFKDANGKPTFCRPGCDTPTENDPERLIQAG